MSDTTVESNVIHTRTIDQLENMSSNDLSNDTENTYLLVANNGYSKKSSLEQLKGVFGSSQSDTGNNSVDNSSEEIYDIGYFSDDTYFSHISMQGTSVTELYECKDEMTVNIHATSTFSATSDLGGNKILLQMSNSNNKDTTGSYNWYTVCQRCYTAKFGEMDIHIRVTPGIVFRIKTDGNVSGCSMDITKIRNHSPFEEHEESYTMYIPLNKTTCQSSGGSGYYTVPYDGVIQIAGNCSITGKSTGNNYDNSMNVHIQKCDADDDESQTSCWYNLQTFAITKAKTSYNVQSRKYLVNKGDKITVRMANKASDNSKTSSYQSNTFIIRFQAFSDLNSKKTTSDQQEFIELSNFNGNYLPGCSDFEVEINSYSKNVDTTYSTKPAAKNIIGFNYIDPTPNLVSSLYYGIKGISENVSDDLIVTYYHGDDDPVDLLYSPSFESQPKYGRYHQYFSNDITAMRYSPASAGYSYFPGNLRTIHRFGTNIQKLKGWCFNECSSLTASYVTATTSEDLINDPGYGCLSIPDTIVDINGHSTFRYCSKLSSIHFPSTLTAFNDLCSTFAYDSELTSVNLQDVKCCTTIGQNAFYNCKKLLSVDLRNVDTISATNLNKNSTYDPFKNVPLTSLVFDSSKLMGGVPSNINIYSFSSFNITNGKIFIISADNCTDFDSKSESEIASMVKQELSYFPRFKNRKYIEVFVCRGDVTRDNALTSFTMG